MGDFRAAFYRGTRPGLAGIYNRAVRLVDRSLYSHGEMVFSDGWAASSSYMDGGVRVKQIDFNPENWDFIYLPDHLEAGSRQWFRDHEGEPYDLRGNLHFVVGPVRDSRKGSFCTEAMAKSIGISEAWRLGPGGLYCRLKDTYPELQRA